MKRLLLVTFSLIIFQVFGEDLSAVDSNLGVYQIELDSVSQLINVSACFHHRVKFLSTGLRSSKGFLLENQASELAFSANGRRMRLSRENHCVSYTVDLHKVQRAQQGKHYPQSWLLNNQAWFWRPTQQGPLLVKFSNKAAGPFNVSVPWTKGTEANSFIAGNTPAGWTSRMAFGQIDIRTLTSENKQIEVAMIGIRSQHKRDEIAAWLDQASDAVTNIYGVFPVENAQVLVAGIGKRREAVPWGEVQRAGSAAVHLFVDETRPIEQYIQDWTAVHELSHLLIPRIHYQDRWLSEGLASYYQNVARSNTQMLSPEQAWQKLSAGFSRGRKAQKGNLRRSSATMHTYWGGAAFYLLADLRLRSLPSPTTLAAVLGKLKQCCMPSDHMWRAKEFTAKMDELSQSKIFSSLLENEAINNAFPIPQDFKRQANTQTLQKLNDIFQKSVPLDVSKD